VTTDARAPGPAGGPDLTLLLNEASRGSREAVDRLLPLVYRELHRMAHRRMRREGPGQTLQATVLTHEAYLRLVDQSRVTWQGRGHFFAMAATTMRRILVDHARRRAREKRGGRLQHVRLTVAEDVAGPAPDEDVLALDEALARLAATDAVKARIVELRFFGGLGVKETAETLGLPVRTVERHWQFARAWLYNELHG